MTSDNSKIPGRTTIAAYALLFPAFALLVTAKETGALPPDEVKRGVGIVLALMLTVTGNFLPKLLHPDRGHAEVLRRQRRAAWGLVLTGAALVVALLAAPADRVELWSGIVGLGGLSIVFLDALIHAPGRVMRERSAAAQGTEERRHAAIRQGALFIIHAIGWVFAMFLADYLWGDAATIWMVIAFTIANGALAIFLAPHFAPRARA